MDRQILVLSTMCFVVTVVWTIVRFGAGRFQRGWFNFVAISGGFLLQTVALWLRGQAIGRCPITNLFEVFIFLSWSIALTYLLVGAAYRLSLMGALTAPLIVLLQGCALMFVDDAPHATAQPVNSWLELHASMSMIAYGSFALACLSGVMYLVQERQLKTRKLYSFFYDLPPLGDLSTAIRRLLWLGLGIYTLGLISGFFTGQELPWFKIGFALMVWLLYAAILGGAYRRTFTPRRVAALCVIGFGAALTLLWGISFTSHPPGP